MSAKTFVDTNILVYAHDSSAGEKHRRAQEILFDLWASGRGCLSLQVLQEFYVTVTRKVAAPMSEETAAEIVRELSTWTVHQPETRDLHDAIEVHRRYQVSFWDAMIVHSADRLGCEVLWSEDLNPGQVYGGVEIRNPFRIP